VANTPDAAYAAHVMPGLCHFHDSRALEPRREPLLRRNTFVMTT